MKALEAIAELCRKGARLDFRVLAEQYGGGFMIRVGVPVEFMYSTNRYVQVDPTDEGVLAALSECATKAGTTAWCDCETGKPRDWSWNWVTDGARVWPALHDRSANCWWNDELDRRYDGIIAWMPMAPPAPHPRMAKSKDQEALITEH